MNEREKSLLWKGSALCVAHVPEFVQCYAAWGSQHLKVYKIIYAIRLQCY